MEKPSRDVLNAWDVLVVDDDPKSLDVLSRILSHYGATVHQAINGEDALKLLDTLRPRFIISDLSMPTMDGWQFISQLRDKPTVAEIPVIALTAHAMIGDRERVAAAGFRGYLSKPISPSTFITDLLLILKDIPNIGVGSPGTELEFAL